MNFSKRSFLRISSSKTRRSYNKQFDLLLISLTLGVILNEVSAGGGGNNNNNPSKGSPAISNKERLDDSDSSASSSGSSHGKYSSGKASSSSYFSAYPNTNSPSYTAFYSPGT